MFRTVLSRGRRALAITSVLLLSAAAVPAQDKPSEPPKRPGEVVATEQVEVLTLDVLAVDGKNRPVFGLTLADFEVKLAGNVQQIDSFEAPAGGPPRAAKARREGRSDSGERIAGTTTTFASEGRAVRHVLFYVDMEQLPKRTIYETANAVRKAMEHPEVARYGLAAHLGQASARVWDTDSPDAILAEADAIAADASSGETTTTHAASLGREGNSTPVPPMAPASYEDRRSLEDALIEDLIWAETVPGSDTRRQVQAIVDYLAAERRRVKASVESLRETAERLASLEGPRHLFILSEGLERLPGFNFLARLRAREAAVIKSSTSRADSAASLGAATPAWAPGAGRSVRGGRFAFNASPLPDVDELSRWLAASGVTVHYLDPSPLGKDLASVEDRYAFESGLRREEARNLQDAPQHFVDATGGLSRLTANDLGAAVEDLLDATTATYRLTMRLSGVDTKKMYSVKVSVKRSGVTALARSAFQPGANKAQAPATLVADARHARLAAAADERRPGAARTAKKPLPVVLEWKGKSTLPSNDPAKSFWKLDVKIPHEALTFRPEEGALLASVQIAVEAAALDGPLRDSVTDDWFLSYTGSEYKEARDHEAVRTVTLQLPPGRWELRVSVHDALGDAFGQETVRVEASR